MEQGPIRYDQIWSYTESAAFVSVALARGLPRSDAGITGFGISRYSLAAAVYALPFYTVTTRGSESMKTPEREGKLLALAGFGAAVAGAALIGARVSPDSGRTKRWYRRLKKPGFTPPRAVFPAVWSVLYPLMALSAYRVWRQGASPARNRALAFWWAQLAANAAWSPLFFGAKRPGAALADLGLLLPLLSAYARESGRVDRTAAMLVTPYLGWTAYAATLNSAIVRANR